MKHLHEPPKDFDAERRTEGRAKGSFVVKVAAPPGSKIAWFSAGGNFATHRLADAKKTRNAIAYAVDQPENYKAIYQADVPLDQAGT